MDNFKELQDIIDHNQSKELLRREKQSVHDQVEKVFAASMPALQSDKDELSEKLREYATVEELTEALKDPAVLGSFFVNELGQDLKLSVKAEDEAREIKFKKDFLIYVKSTQLYNDKIDEAFKEKEEAEKEFNQEMSDCIRLMSDQFLMHVDHMEKKLQNPELTPEQRAQGEKRLIAIKTGYTFQYFIDLLDKHPNLKGNIKKDLDTDWRRNKILTTYAQKTKAASVNPVLGHMFHNDKVSLERNFLVDGEYSVEGLALFFIVRTFSMNGFEGLNRTMHSAVSLILTKMVKNDIEDVFKEEVVNGIRNLAAKLM